MTTVEVLRRAKAELLRRGWHQRGWEVRPGGPCCVGRALTVAHGTWQFGALEELAGYAELVQAAGVKPGQLTYWNDHRARSVDDVLAVIDIAIALAEAASPGRGG